MAYISRYKKLNNSYTRFVSEAWEDRIEVEVGDTKQPDRFYPQFKLKRWDNEVNVSVRLKDDDYDSASIIEGLDKIHWQRGKRKVSFYDVPAQSGHLMQEGGYEIDVTLLE